jgi:uncharacterized membrane protein
MLNQKAKAKHAQRDVIHGSLVVVNNEDNKQAERAVTVAEIDFHGSTKQGLGMPRKSSLSVGGVKKSSNSTTKFVSKQIIGADSRSNDFQLIESLMSMDASGSSLAQSFRSAQETGLSPGIPPFATGGGNKVEQMNTRVPRSVAMERNSNWVTNTIETFLDLLDNVSRSMWTFRSSIHGIRTVPLVGTFLVTGFMYSVLYSIQNLSLPDLKFYNAVHIILALLSDLSVFLFRYIIYQSNRRKTAHDLLKGTITATNMMRASKGTLGPAGKVFFYLLLVFQCSILAIAFTADWAPQSSQLGNFPCVVPDYRLKGVQNISASQAFLQGNIDFSLIYMYGLPLADGVIMGLGPVPLSQPLANFSIIGQGPAIIMQSDCETFSSPWHGQNKSLNGNGLNLFNLINSTNGFTANIEVLLPTVGLAGRGDIETPWAKQMCRLRVMMGQGNWTFNYMVDQWKMVTAGQVTQVQLTERHVVTRYQSGSLHADDYIKLFEQTKRWKNYQGLLQLLQRSVRELTKDVWYPASSGGVYSNFLSWGTSSDGLYHENITHRGLVAGMASAARMVLVQCSEGDVQSCPYYGMEGGGNFIVNPALVLFSQIVLLLTAAGCILNIFYLHVICPIKDNSFFRQALLDVSSEWRRLCHFSEFVTFIAQNQKITQDMPTEIERTFELTDVKFGEAKYSMTQPVGRLCISASEDVARLRVDRRYV